MKVRVLKPFISGRDSGEKGEVKDYSTARAKYFIGLGFVEAVAEKAPSKRPAK